MLLAIGIIPVSSFRISNESMCNVLRDYTGRVISWMCIVIICSTLGHSDCIAALTYRGHCVTCPSGCNGGSVITMRVICIGFGI